MNIKRRIATVAVVATGLLGIGLPMASAHANQLAAEGICSDDGTRVVTYTGTTTEVPEPDKPGTLTVVSVSPSGTEASPASQTVVGNTTYSFTQTIPGDATSVSATVHLEYVDFAPDDVTATAEFTENCTPPVVVPEKPAPVVDVESSEAKDCDSKEITTTTVTTTTDWVLDEAKNEWVKGEPVVKKDVTTRATTPEECVETPTVAGVVEEAPPVVAGVVEEAAVNPLPVAAAAGQADTSGQLAAGGFAAFAAFLMLGAGFVLRRRHGEV